MEDGGGAEKREPGTAAMRGKDLKNGRGEGNQNGWICMEKPLGEGSQPLGWRIVGRGQILITHTCNK